MIKFKELEATNMVLFKHLKLPLDKYPLVVVRGKNLDRRSVKSTNAVGKSLAYSLIPTLRYNAVPSAVKKKSAKDIHDKDSKLTLRIENNGRNYDFIQAQHRKTVSYDVLEDGKSLKFRGNTRPQDFIAKIMPINQTQYYAFNHIDAYTPHPLQRGTDTQRFEFFEKISKLDVYDKIAAQIAKEYNALKYEAQRLKEVEADYAIRKAELPKRSLSELKERRLSLAERANKVRKKVDKYLNELREITAYMTLAEDHDPRLTIPKVKEKLQEFTTDVEHLEGNLKESVAYHATLEKIKEQEEFRNSLEKRLSKYKVDNFPSPDDCEELLITWTDKNEKT